MINDGIGFQGKIEYTLFDENGNVKDYGIIHNQVQTLVRERVIDALDTGTFGTEIVAMAVGYGDQGGTYNGSVGSAHLWSKASDEDLTSQTQPTSTTLQNVATFRSITGTIKEAGLFDASACADDMYFHNHTLNVVMTASDSLQITWTISCTSA